MTPKYIIDTWGLKMEESLRMDFITLDEKCFELDNEQNVANGWDIIYGTIYNDQMLLCVFGIYFYLMPQVFIGL